MTDIKKTPDTSENWENEGGMIFSADVTPMEFLARIPKKNKEDHAKDLKEMKKVSEKLKKINLNPKMDLEEAIKRVEMLTAKNKSKRTKSRNPGYNC